MTHALRPLVVAIVASAGVAAHAQTVSPAGSEIGFTMRQMGVPVDGKFTRWTAQVAFDPKKPEAGRVAFTIETGSVTLGTAEVDAEAAKAAWFNVAKFPQASFQSTSIKPAGAGRYEVAGKLSIKGNVHDVVVPVTLAQSGSQGTASGTFAIKRLEFKIGEGEWADTSMVANDVSVKFKLALTGLQAP